MGMSIGFDLCVVVDGIDRDGVLPLWIPGSIHSEWKSVE